MSNKFEEFLESSGLEMRILGHWVQPKGDKYKVELSYENRKWVGYAWSDASRKELTLRDVMHVLLWYANSGMEETLDSYLDQYEEEDETPLESRKRYAAAVEDYKEMSTLLGSDYDTFLQMWFDHN